MQHRCATDWSRVNLLCLTPVIQESTLLLPFQGQVSGKWAYGCSPEPRAWSPEPESQLEPESEPESEPEPEPEPEPNIAIHISSEYSVYLL